MVEVLNQKKKILLERDDPKDDALCDHIDVCISTAATLSSIHNPQTPRHTPRLRGRPPTPPPLPPDHHSSTITSDAQQRSRMRPPKSRSLLPRVAVKNSLRMVFQLYSAEQEHDAPSVRYGADDAIPRGGIMEQDFLLFDSMAIAKELTRIEFDLFRKIQPRELLNQAWQKDNKHEKAPNVTNLISRFNEVSYWVATEILKTQGPKMQSVVMKKFIEIANICYKMSNFNTLMEMLIGLNNSSVQRLSDTWKNVGEKALSKFKKLDTLMSPKANYGNYRTKLKKRALETPRREKGKDRQGREQREERESTTGGINSRARMLSPRSSMMNMKLTSLHPILPYFALLLRDMTFTHEGNAKYLEDSSINWDLVVMSHQLVSVMQQFQENSSVAHNHASSGHYGIGLFSNNQSSERLKQFFSKLDHISDDALLYNLSLKTTPERKTIVHRRSISDPNLKEEYELKNKMILQSSSNEEPPVESVEAPAADVAAHPPPQPAERPCTPPQKEDGVGQNSKGWVGAKKKNAEKKPSVAVAVSFGTRRDRSSSWQFYEALSHGISEMMIEQKQKKPSSGMSKQSSKTKKKKGEKFKNRNKQLQQPQKLHSSSDSEGHFFRNLGGGASTMLQTLLQSSTSSSSVTEHMQSTAE